MSTIVTLTFSRLVSSGVMELGKSLVVFCLPTGNEWGSETSSVGVMVLGKSLVVFCLSTGNEWGSET